MMDTRKRKNSSSNSKKVHLSYDQLMKAGVTEAAARKLCEKEICEKDLDSSLRSWQIKDERNRMIMSAFLTEMEEMDLHPPESKVLNDPVHGLMEFHPLCMAVIDTPQFQRLRHLKQLGMAYYVYPGASHNRFEHSLGVGHLAGILARALKERQPELSITTRDIMCVQIAGLCHDLGHGPFSHLYDQQFIPVVTGDNEWKHEQSSLDMFDYMVEANHLEDIFKKYGFTELHRIFIKELILGKPCMPPDEKGEVSMRYGKEKAFLYETVANNRNGVDVDKWDYFKRDCHHLGITATFDHNRFIRFARVITVKGEKQICVRDKERFNMYEMFHTRHALHRKAYQHKVVQAIDIMVVEALRAADNHITIRGKNGKTCKMSDCIKKENIDALTNLTDNVFHDILTSEKRELEPARRILHNIQCRKLYKCLKESVPISDRSLIDREDNRSEIRTEILEQLPLDQVKAHNLDARLLVQVAHLDFGGKYENPVDKINFYSKDKPDEAVELESKDVSYLMPRTQFKEMVVRVYLCPTWDKEKDKLCKELLEEGFANWCQANGLQKPQDMVDIQRSEEFSTPDRPTNRERGKESAMSAKHKLEYPVQE